MAWLLLVVALALVAGYLIITYGYRNSLFVLLTTLLIGVVGVIWYAEFYDGEQTSAIAVEDVSLDNFSVRTTYGDSFAMNARLRNASEQYVLSAVGIELSASDCTAGTQGESCIVVGQEEKEIQVEVPAGQARDIVEQFIFPPIRPNGELKWSYLVLYTRARK